ncbi:hypothetical protein pdam_00011463 [Pocillopora damicornis]|uniref:VWFA domain-containing protein n=1 Tax=Pocillopora damicornis TaxID=46731 RepID=A0A3M6USI2_POCDA|nr:hypothetical protein pdam_00011463 [Pocillopora damicornis]
MVLRMPGKAFPEKCAWAARINRDNVIAVTSGVNPKCTSSKGLKGSDKSIFDPMNQMVCVGTAGERELFFVGAAAPCVLGSKDVDVGIVVDLSAENIPFLLTIVDSLEVDPRENHIGVIVSQGAKKIHVKLSDPAGSKDETTLLRYIQDAARHGNLASSADDYEKSVSLAQELFRVENGGREGAQHVLLVVTDATNEFIGATSAANKINELKVNLILLNYDAANDNKIWSVELNGH